MTAATLIDPTLLAQGQSGVDGVEYTIGPADKVRLTVFQVPDLSFEELRVDSAGNVQLPLIGSTRAAGYTPAELSRELEGRLGQRYLRNPQVSVTLVESASQKITVEGAVTKPGVYEMLGRTSLLQAVAMAEGETRVANSRQAVVFRNTVDGRQAAVFDLLAIRAGQQADPTLNGDDIVIIDASRLNVVWRDIISALPAIGSFLYLGQ